LQGLSVYFLKRQSTSNVSTKTTSNHNHQTFFKGFASFFGFKLAKMIN